VEVRSDDGEVLELVKKIDHRESRLAVFAERAFLRRLEGGCQVPVGALGTVENDRLRLEGVVATPDGKQLVRSFVEGNGGDAAAIGLRLAEKLLELGAGEILKRARQEERRE